MEIENYLNFSIGTLKSRFMVARVGRSRSGPVFGTPLGPSLGLGPVSVHLGHGPVRS